MSRRRVLALAAALLSAAPVATATAQARPDDDPFYGVPAGIAGLADGTVIDARPVTATRFSLPIDADAWQVRFKTRDTTGAPSAYLTTVLRPRTPWTGDGPRPVLSYQMPEDGVGLRCAPSWVLTQGLRAPTNTTPDAQTVASAVERGWTVVVPDYQGPDSAWLGADGQARGVLDGLRAARAFAPAGIDPRAPIGLWGYSGGAIASSPAAQLHPTHAPELPLVGVALGGNNASIREGLRAFDGGPAGGAIVIGLIGLDRAYPQARLTSFLSARGRAAVARSQDDCIVDAALKHPAFRAADGLTDPGAIDREPFTEVFRQASPLTYPGVPAVPVYDYHATGDELAPIAPSRELLRRFCRAGVPVEHVEHPGEHFTEVAVGEPGALRFLAARFAGRPANSTCTVPPDPAPSATPGARPPAVAPGRPCAPRRTFAVAVRRPARGRLVAVRATLGGRRVAVGRDRRGRSVVRVRLAGRRPGLVTLRIVARTSTGARLVQTRTYRVCAPRRS
ncbi:lipase family protein [Conexibacter sp. W3-3-2]|uniref:lipase family protein n=1 Tax=Conexibacter sp. W3-3-2 TaxID=2675227 RepID=UPI0018AC746E|nr:lipase family protein [Conexibacter sp. W3-3-2]